MDKIILRNMKFHGYHGLYDKEKIQGQTFIVDLEMQIDTAVSGKTDNIIDTVDYSLVFEMVKNITENDRFQLVEKLADTIANKILSTFNKIYEVTVTVKKPQAPINGEFDWVGVSIIRNRNV